MKWFGKAAVVWLGGVLVFAQQNVFDGITITYAPPKLTVSVTQTADLAVILAKLCKETQSDCDGIERAASSKVSPVTLHGGWDEVIDQLMAGSGLNYAMSSPSSKSRGRLIVQGNKLALPDVVSSMQNPQTMTTEAGSEPSTSPAMSDSATPSSENKETSAQNETIGASQPNGAAMAMGAYQNSSGGSLRGSPFSGLPAESGSPTKISFSPFPDSHGNLIPVKDETPLYSPFPDSHGNLIPVDPNKITGSPFPIELMRKADSQNH